MPDTDSGAPAQPKSKLLRSVLIVVVALVVFGAAFWYVGGVDYVMGLLGGGSPATAATTTKPAPSATSSATSGALKLPAGVDETLAKRMYVEQIESSANLAKLAKGEVSKLVINRVDATDSTATVSLSAVFKDGTSAPGVMYLVKRSGSWYFMAIGGLNVPNASGLAGGVGTQGTGEITVGTAADVEKAMAVAGIKTFDNDIINTILSQQVSNQPMLKEFVGGTYTTYEFGTPTAGTGTVTLPVTLSGKSGSPESGELLFVSKKVDGSDRTFVTTFRKR